MFDFIRHIRNALNHMSFDVSKRFNLQMNDIDKKTNKTNFSCTFDFDNLHKLIDALLREYVKSLSN